MKTILIPTDYSEMPLSALSSVCAKFKNEAINLIFIHVFKLSDSITDVLMLSRRSREYEKVSDEFYNGCNTIRANHPNVKNIKIEFLYGSTLSMFKNFIEANEVNMVLKQEDSSFKPMHRSSIDPSVLVSRSGLPVVTVSGKTTQGVKQADTAAVYQEEDLLTEV